MSIDTAEKRRSASGVWTGVFPVAVTTTALTDQEWRQQAGWGYAGILSSILTYESVTMGDFFVLDSYVPAVTTGGVPTLIAAVDAASPAGAGGTSADIDTSGATLIVVFTGHHSAGSSTVPLTFSDSLGNTWTPLTLSTHSYQQARIFYCVNPLVGEGHTFTVSTGGLTHPVWFVYAFSGVESYHAETFNNTYNIPPVASGSLTPVKDGSVFVTGLTAVDTGTDAVSPVFTTTTRPYALGVQVQGTAGYLLQPTAAAINPTWTWTGFHQLVAVASAVFSAADTLAPVAMGDFAVCETRRADLQVKVD